MPTLVEVVWMPGVMSPPRRQATGDWGVPRGGATAQLLAQQRAALGDKEEERKPWLRTSCVPSGRLLGGGGIDTRPRRGGRMPHSKGTEDRESSAILCHQGYLGSTCGRVPPPLRDSGIFWLCLPCQISNWALTSSLGFWS